MNKKEAKSTLKKILNRNKIILDEYSENVLMVNIYEHDQNIKKKMDRNKRKHK